MVTADTQRLSAQLFEAMIATPNYGVVCRRWNSLCATLKGVGETPSRYSPEATAAIQAFMADREFVNRYSTAVTSLVIIDKGRNMQDCIDMAVNKLGRYIGAVADPLASIDLEALRARKQALDAQLLIATTAGDDRAICAGCGELVRRLKSGKRLWKHVDPETGVLCDQQERVA